MAQIKNPEDGNQRGKVTILGYSERFFMNATPPVHIMKDLLEIGEVEKNGKIEIDIDKESRIVFKCNQCSCRFSPIVVKPGDWVVLIYNRGVDSMLPIITDEANHLRVREEYHESERRESKKFFLRMLMIVLILCGVAGGIYGGIHAKQVRDRKARLARILEDRSLFNIENPNAYTIEELERMQYGYDLLPFELREKVERNGDVNYSKSIMSNVDAENMREISSHPWKRVIAGDPYGKCILEVLYFNENGQGTCYEELYAGGNKVITPYNKKPFSFDFSYYIDGEKVYCGGTWEYVFKDGKLYDKENHLYKSGSDLIY